MIDITNYIGLYAVTEDGRVWSYPKKNKYNPNHNGLWLSAVISDGYKYVTLHKDGKQKKCAVHRLACDAFIPRIEDKKHVNHINGIKTDNNIENLEWCSPQENCQHAWDNGLSTTNKNVRKLSSEKMKKWNESEKGKIHCSKNGLARRKLSKEQVVEIFTRNKNGESAYFLSKIYPVSKQTILKIVNKESYKEFTNEL